MHAALILLPMFVTSVLSQSLPRYYDTTDRVWITVQNVTNLMAESTIVFVGEYHDHEWGHKIELDLLKKFYSSVSSTDKFALSLEMFERDIQILVSGYLKDQLTEEFFLENSRPWPNYSTDYKPLVEYIKNVKRDVLAANIPRRYAAMVAGGNETYLWHMPENELSYMADKIYAPHDKYYDIFYDLFKKQNWTLDKVENYYRAQCIKDDTMAMSITQYVSACRQAKQSVKIFSVTGSFHVDYHLGTFQRVRRNIPDVKMLLISIIPWNPRDVIKPENYLDLADIVVFAPQNEKY